MRGIVQKEESSESDRVAEDGGYKHIYVFIVRTTTGLVSI